MGFHLTANTHEKPLESWSLSRQGLEPPSGGDRT